VKVLILDAATTQALTAVRSLGNRGIDVTAADSVRWAKSFSSRFCGEALAYTPPEVGIDAFLKRVQDLLRAKPYDLLLPMSDRTTLPISLRREEVSPLLKALPLPPHEALEVTQDKGKTLHLAQSLDVPVPETQCPDDLAQLEELVDSFPYPVVVKPRASYRVVGDRIISGGRPQYAFNREEFIAKYKAVHQQSPFPLVQEFVPGVGFGVFALMHNGKLRALFGHQRLREMFPTGSGSSYRASVPVDPRMRDYALRLLQALNWHGVAMVEFKQDRRDGIPKLMEINGRFWGSLPLAIAAGMDFPYLLCRMMLEGDIDEVMTYRAGVRCRWLVGDLVHLGEVLKGPPPGWPGPFPRRGETVRDFCHLFGKDLYYDDFQFCDVKPFFAEMLDYASRRLPQFWRKQHGWSRKA
jgi:predicted ATP-grasp superfamily ATP-dependent carboligase